MSAFIQIFLDIETTGLKPLEDKIVAIGIHVNSEIFEDENVCVTDTKIWLAEGDDGKHSEEKELEALLELNDMIQKLIRFYKDDGRTLLLVGYNIGFDLGFVSARSAILYQKYPKSGEPKLIRRVRNVLGLAGLLRELPRVDLMHVISRYWFNTNKHVKMKDVCSALGINYDDCDGSEIPKLVEEGNWIAVEEHLKADLYRLSNLYGILKSQGLIAHNLRVRYNLFDCEVDLL